jgi:hypothetical protein
MGRGNEGGGGCKEIGGIYISDQQENHPAENQRTENPTSNGETIYKYKENTGNSNPVFEPK